MDENVVFIDTETTGLDPLRHEVWDIALIEIDGTEHEWHLRPQRPEAAEPGALRVNRFYERTAKHGWAWSLDRPNLIASEIAGLTANHQIAGIVPDFDAGFLSRLLIENGQREAWHYHLIDVEVLAVGYLRGRQRRAGRGRGERLVPPYDTKEVIRQLGINGESPTFEKHTAIGDARLARAIYMEVMEGRHIE